MALTLRLPGLALAALALAAAAPAPARAADLTDLLECRDGASLATPLADVMRMADGDAFSCRLLDARSGASATCTATGARLAFGLRVRDFTLAEDGRGGRLLAVAFALPPSGLEPAVERARAGSPAASPLTTSRIGEREDGVAELLCSLRSGGAGTGAIAGALDFRGMQPVPPMRVCAAPVERVDSPQCVQTVAGSSRFRIDALAAGDYYVTAYPLDNNPGRLIAAYARPLPGCRDDACPHRLQPVSVAAGQVRDGIDPLSLLPGLPAALRAGATEGR